VATVLLVLIALDGDTYVGLDGMEVNLYQLAFVDAPQSKDDPKLRRVAKTMHVSPQEWLRRGLEAKRLAKTLMEGRPIVACSPQTNVFVRDHRKRIVVIVTTARGDFAALLLRRGLGRLRSGMEPG